MKRRRFVAGAVCPACGEVDRVVVEEEHRRCVSCGFREARPRGAATPETTPTPAEPAPVRFVDD